MAKMSLIDAAREVLKDEPRGLTIAEVFRRAMESGLIRPTGKTPANTMRANIYDHVRRHGPNSDFMSMGGGRWGLAKRKK